MEVKSWYQSKTIWTNFAALLGAAGGFFTGAAPAEAAITAGVMALVNIILRMVTKAPLE